MVLFHDQVAEKAELFSLFYHLFQCIIMLNVFYILKYILKLEVRSVYYQVIDKIIILSGFPYSSKVPLVI